MSLTFVIPAVIAVLTGCWCTWWLFRRGPGPGSRLEGQLRRAAAEQLHPFGQDPAALSVRVCWCGRWPDHHIHTGDPETCTCERCRVAVSRA